jgi:hypothetical protein
MRFLSSGLWLLLLLGILGILERSQAQQLLNNQQGFWNDSSIAVSGRFIYIAKDGKLYRGDLSQAGVPLSLVGRRGWYGSIAISNDFIYLVRPQQRRWSRDGRDWRDGRDGRDGRDWREGREGRDDRRHDHEDHSSVLYRGSLFSQSIDLLPLAASEYLDSKESFALYRDKIFFKHRRALYQGTILNGTLQNVEIAQEEWHGPVLVSESGRFYERQQGDLYRSSWRRGRLIRRTPIVPNPLNSVQRGELAVSEDRLYVANAMGLFLFSLAQVEPPRPPSNPSPHEPHIDVERWNVQNAFRGEFQVIATAHGQGAASLALYAVLLDGSQIQLASQACRNRSTITFTGYNLQRNTRRLELRLLDFRGNVLDVESQRFRSRNEHRPNSSENNYPDMDPYPDTSPYTGNEEEEEDPYFSPYSQGKIEILNWEVTEAGQHSNMPGVIQTAKVKAVVRVQAQNASRVALYGVYPDGTTQELQAGACQNGASVYFDSPYPQDVQAFRILVFDTQSKVLAQEEKVFGSWFETEFPENYSPSQQPEYPQEYQATRLEFLKWQARLGDAYNPRANLVATVYGTEVNTISLYALYGNTPAEKLQTHPCSSGSAVAFNTSYPPGIQFFRFIVEDRHRNILLQEEHPLDYVPPSPQLNPLYPPQNPPPVEPPPPAGRIVIQKWDVGGGNFFRSKAKISATVYGSQLQTATLYGVSRDGKMEELQSLSCQNGANIYFDVQYLGAFHLFRVVLYNNVRQVLAVEERS